MKRSRFSFRARAEYRARLAAQHPTLEQWDSCESTALKSRPSGRHESRRDGLTGRGLPGVSPPARSWL
jgi:hypothetical protein